MATPIYTSQPTNISTLNNQFSNPALLQQLAQSNPIISGALQSLEGQRVYAGSQPYSTNQAIGAAIAAQNQGVVTQPKPGNPWFPQNIFHNAVHDVGNIVGNIPNMPFQIVNEATKIPQIPHDINQNLSWNKSGGIFNAPVIRMIPGAQTLSAALPGGAPAGNLISHPVNTALDLTPYAVAKVFPARFAGLGEAASEVDKVTAATSSIADNVAGKPAAPNMINEEPGLAGQSLSGGGADQATGSLRPGRVSAAQIVGQSAPYQALVGKAVNPAVDYLANSGPGQYIREAVGPEARNLSRSYTVADQTARRNQAAANLAATETEQPLPPSTRVDDLSNWMSDVSKPKDQGGFAIPRAQIEAELNLRPQAEEMAQRQPIEGMPPEVQVQRNMDYLMKQKGYDTPQATYHGQTIYGDQDMVVPKVVQRNIDRLTNPVTKNPLLKATDPLMRVFRMTHLGLSPAFAVHRLMGDTIKMFSNSTAREMLDYTQNMKDYLSSFKEIRKNPNIESTRFNNENVPVSDWLKAKMHGQTKLESSFNESSAGTQIRILKQLADSGVGKILKKVGSGLDKVGHINYELSDIFDNAYTAMKYLYGYKEGMEGGLTREEAMTRGMEAAQKTMMDWTDMTPLERQIGKSIFPFYGYAQHIIRFSLKYPADHPWRAAIVNSFAQAEEQDRASGLPDSFRHLFVYGKPDAQGNRRALDLSSTNPFKSVANYFTLPGLMRATNPVIQVGMEQLGVKPQSAGPDLYPNLNYNPNTGQLEYQRPGLLSSLLPTVLPQAQALEELSGQANAFKQLSRSNPAAAQKLLLTEAGIPSLVQTVNPTQAIMKSEINAEKAQQTALSTALRSGDPSGLNKWPAAKARYNQIQQMAAAGQLPQYLPLSQPQDAVSNATNSIAASVSGR